MIIGMLDYIVGTSGTIHSPPFVPNKFWTLSESGIPEDVDLTCVFYYPPGIYIVGGTKGTMYYYDEKNPTWKPCNFFGVTPTTTINQIVNCIKVNTPSALSLLAVGNDGLIMTSGDGINWKITPKEYLTNENPISGTSLDFYRAFDIGGAEGIITWNAITKDGKIFTYNNVIYSNDTSKSVIDPMRLKTDAESKKTVANYDRNAGKWVYQRTESGTIIDMAYDGRRMVCILKLSEGKIITNLNESHSVNGSNVVVAEHGSINPYGAINLYIDQHKYNQYLINTVAPPAAYFTGALHIPSYTCEVRDFAYVSNTPYANHRGMPVDSLFQFISIPNTFSRPLSSNNIYSYWRNATSQLLIVGSKGGAFVTTSWPYNPDGKSALNLGPTVTWTTDESSLCPFGSERDINATCPGDNKFIVVGTKGLIAFRAFGFDPPDNGSPDFISHYDIVIPAGTTVYDFNLQSDLKNMGWNGFDQVHVNVTIESGAIVGCKSANAAFTIDPFIAESINGVDPGTSVSPNVVNIVNNGTIIGKGGTGGDGGGGTGDDVDHPSLYKFPAKNGKDGGTAIYTRHYVVITNNGIIAGGGGGGGGGGAARVNLPLRTRAVNVVDGSLFTFAGGGGGGGGAGYGAFGLNGVSNYGIVNPLYNPQKGAQGETPATALTGGKGKFGYGYAASGSFPGGTGGSGGNGGEPGRPGYSGEIRDLVLGTGMGGQAGLYINGSDLAVFVVKGTLKGDSYNVSRDQRWLWSMDPNQQ